MRKPLINKSGKILWVLIAVLIIAIIFLWKNGSFNQGVKTLSEAEKAKIQLIENDVEDLNNHWTHEIEQLISVKNKLSETSESFRLTELLIGTFSDFKKEVNDLKEELKNVHDSVGINYCQQELNDLTRAWEGSKKLLNEHRKLLNTFGLITAYESRIDSLKNVLANEKNLLSLSKSEKISLQNEIKDYETKLAQLKSQGFEFKLKNDSLNAIAQNQAKTIDSLTFALELQRKAYDDLLLQAKKNAVFANKLSLWYYEKDNKRKPRRRQLSETENDFNKGSEIKAINGEFTVSADTYEPFQVATVFLFANEANTKTELAQVQITVRDQISGEFVLIPTEKLKPGKYLVEVIYTNKTILTQNFYVNQ